MHPTNELVSPLWQEVTVEVEYLEALTSFDE